ncbi:MAG: site-specific DNA-methyltransferase [Candidatus Zixiibacteriota bacterium]
MRTGKTSSKRAENNRTVSLTTADKRRLRDRLVSPDDLFGMQSHHNILIHGDIANAVRHLERHSIDLMVLDPPYNLTKRFNGRTFSKTSRQNYSQWLEGYLRMLLPLLKPTASVYICGDWRSSVSIYDVASEHLIVRNRITWEREKGRGAKANWKNASEDIWFCTVSDSYTFNLDAVKLRRKVLAPYRGGDGSPKDWFEADGGSFRDTAPSNIWTDITIPFWSMPENTDHPTQKSEKLIAKLILASSKPEDVVFDPFAGSGTSAVTAKKLGRTYIAVEIDEEYCLLAARRLELAESEQSVQGLVDGVFWERNTHRLQKKS